MSIVNDSGGAPQLAVSVGFPSRGHAQVQIVVTLDGALSPADAATIRATVNAAIASARASRVTSLKEQLADFTEGERGEVAEEATRVRAQGEEVGR